MTAHRAGGFLRLRSCIRGALNRLSRDPEFFLNKVRGVIHIGANLGQERDHYAAHGLKVVWVEPIPEVYAGLRDNLASYPGQQAFQGLVTDCDDREYAFHVSNNEGVSSSILDFAGHKEIWPEVRFQKTITLRSITLTSLVRRQGLDLADYDALVLDTQGSELLVLRGAHDLLSCFRFIKAEVADFESYAGCCRLPDLDAFLRGYGFRRVAGRRFAHKGGVGSYFDVTYQNRWWGDGAGVSPPHPSPPTMRPS